MRARPFSRRVIASALIVCALALRVAGEVVELAASPSPPDNPLKGLVPYAHASEADRARFPHSMEFGYVPLAALMKAPGRMDWTELDALLNRVGARGHHAIFRVWLEYPGKADGIPGFLLEEGLKVTEWAADAGGRRSLTPDYADERLVVALENFIAALGRKYDGDARIGYLTAGLLGSWGEWHTWPREELFAPISTQRRVLDAYEQAFTRTPVLLRYPAGDGSRKHAPNAARAFGYHDDSFAWGTIAEPDRRNSGWFYMTTLRAAGPAALDKWRTRPIGGEIRPEAWGIVFDDQPARQEVQDFPECVRQTHVSWLMDSGMFRPGNAPERRQRAIELVRGMGYDFSVRTADITRVDDELRVRLAVVNQGVAPFYHDWRLELAALSADGRVLERWPVDWQLTSLLPGDPPRTWQASLEPRAERQADEFLALRVINPLPNGKPLRFANATQDQHAAGWLTLGRAP